MSSILMNLKILLPSQVFLEKSGIKRITMDTSNGSVGFLPHRLDCVAALVPGILIYENETEGENYVAVDNGVVVKTCLSVLISVRNAVAVTDLGQLSEMVEREFLMLGEREKSVRQVLTKIENGFIRHLAELHHV